MLALALALGLGIGLGTKGQQGKAGALLTGLLMLRSDSKSYWSPRVPLGYQVFGLGFRLCLCTPFHSHSLVQQADGGGSQLAHQGDWPSCHSNAAIALTPQAREQHLCRCWMVTLLQIIITYATCRREGYAASLRAGPVVLTNVAVAWSPGDSATCPPDLAVCTTVRGCCSRCVGSQCFRMSHFAGSAAIN